MQSILKFNLPEDNHEFNVASKAMDWALAMFDLDNFLRNKLKYEDAGEDFEKIRNKLYDILNDRNLNLDEIE